MGRIKIFGGRYYDIGTSNISFLEVAKDLKTVGVKNWYFMLEIKDYSLVGVDPHAADKDGKCTLTRDQIERIHLECRRNPWYYLRECARIPDPGNPLGVPYKANRGNLAQAWAFFHGIDSWLCLTRQQGKTQSALAAIGWAYSYGTTDTGFIFINKDAEGAQENLQRLAEQIRLLPIYMQFSWIEEEDGTITKETDNAKTRKHPVTKNKITTKPKAATYNAALSLARGLTTAIQHFDEPEFTENIKTIIENSVSTFETAARRARENNGMYGRIFTCTPGDLDTPAGKEAQLVLDNTVRWSESMYDKTREEMEEYVSAGNSNQIVYIEYQYYQIGLDRQWLEKISAKIGNVLTVRREILLQRLHGSSLSPFPQEEIEYIMDQMHQPVAELFIMKYYRFDLYVEELDPSIPYIVGIDCSTGTDGDSNAITIINPYTVMPVAEFECSYIGETKYEKLIVELVTRHIPKAIVCIERNHVGDGIIDHLLEESPIANRLYYDKAKDLQGEKLEEKENMSESMLKRMAKQKLFYGVFTSGSSRESMIAILSRHVSEFKQKFVTRNICRDLSRLVRTTSGKIEAGKGFHDDSIMSYLIALYVFYHGNNLYMFGFDPASAPAEEKNAGLYRPVEELEELLPREAVVEIAKAEEVRKLLEYEDIFRKAVMESQDATRRLMESSLNVTKEGTSLRELKSFDDEEGQIPLDLFDELNGF